MVWQELSIKVPWEYVEPISYLFSRYGRGLSMEAAEDELVLLRTYLPNTSRRRLARIEVGVNLVRILQPMGELAIKELEEADWESAWKAHFSLLKVGSRLVIKPSWIAYEARQDDVVIELDPGMAFGTGYHPTTKMCLEALEWLVQPGIDVLDLGTGSGILTIAAARLDAASVVALDIDPTAVKVARKNFRATGIMSVVRLIRGTLPHPLAQEGHFRPGYGQHKRQGNQGKGVLHSSSPQARRHAHSIGDYPETATRARGDTDRCGLLPPEDL